MHIQDENTLKNMMGIEEIPEPICKMYDKWQRRYHTVGSGPLPLAVLMVFIHQAEIQGLFDKMQIDNAITMPEDQLKELPRWSLLAIKNGEKKPIRGRFLGIEEDRVLYRKILRRDNYGNEVYGQDHSITSFDSVLLVKEI